MASLLTSVRRKIIVIALSWIFILAAFAIRLYNVQIVRHAELTQKAKIKYSKTDTITGKRGLIYDVNGTLLVTNMPKVEIAVSPYHAVHETFSAREKSRKKERRDAVPELREQRRRRLALIFSRHLPEPFEYYYHELAPFRTRIAADGTRSLVPNTHLMLDKTASIEAAQKLKDDLKKHKIALATFSFKDIYVRHHPKGRLLSDVLGYTDVDLVKEEGKKSKEQQIAKAGLEKELNERLASSDGEYSYEKGRRGGVLSYGNQYTKEANDGKDIYLTIDEGLQSILEEELDNAVREWNPENIFAVIADPRTGDILALAQRPTWDPNDRSTFVLGKTGTRFAGSSYEPGSIFKPFFVAKALDWGVVTPGERINCENGMWIYAGRKLNDVGRYGDLSIGEILKKSSNIGSAKIGLRLGDQRLNEVRRMFGFGQKTGLPFHNETPGFLTILPKAKVTSSRVPIGYASRVTILQLARAYSALATGKLPSLNIVDRIVDPKTGKITMVKRNAAIPVFQNSEAHKQLVEMLCSVTAKDGTGKRAAVKGYEVAGKTGTSRKHVPGHGYPAGCYYTSFAGFLPARAPRLVMIVTVDHPKGKNLGGGSVAAPIFRKTMEKAVRYLNIPPDFPEE